MSQEIHPRYFIVHSDGIRTRGGGRSKDLAVCRRNMSMNNEKDNQYRSHNAISEVCLSTSMSLSTYSKASAFTCGMPCVEILSPSKRWGLRSRAQVSHVGFGALTR